MRFSTIADIRSKVGPATTAALLAVVAATTGRAESRQPNVVVILADDLGYGDAACYNPTSGRIPTPNIDKLAHDGMRFTDAHSSSSVCSPTRYALLTGRYHWRTRLQQGIVGPWGAPLIAADRLTLAGLFKQSGYATAIVGKWHLGWNWPIPADDAAYFSGLTNRKDAVVEERGRAAWQNVFAKPIADGPTTRGFDHYFGTCVPNWPPYCFIDDDRTVGIPSELLPRKLFDKNMASVQGPALPDWNLQAVLPTLTDRAVEWLEKPARSKEPFFLYFPLTTPHTPLAVNDSWRGKSGLNDYADLVMETDAAVGRVLEALDQSGAAENTIVVLTSDNGCASYIGVRELEAAGHFPSGPLRGYKAGAFEGGHRIPFIVRWPGSVRGDSVCHQLVHQADLMATFAEILDVRLPANAGEDSVSLLPLLKGDDRPTRSRAVSQSAGGVSVVRDGNWVLIAEPLRDQSVQLYDLSNDLAQDNNIAAEHPEQVRQMIAWMEEIVSNGRSTPGPNQSNDVPVRWKRFIEPHDGR